jgi:hypothetical protein
MYLSLLVIPYAACVPFEARNEETIMIKRQLWLILALMIFGVLLSIPASPASAQGEPIERTVIVLDSSTLIAS